MIHAPSLVSIVVPAYNAERFLADALATVCAQSHRAIEVIVVDDASTDATPTIAQSTGDPRVRYLRNERTHGGYGAMNRGVRESHGEFVAIYHADALYDPRIVERELALLESRADLGAVFCLDRFIDEDGREYARLKLPTGIEQATVFDTALLAESLLRYKNTFLPTPSVLFRRAAFDPLGGFDQERFGLAADLDLWVRFSVDWRIALLHEYLMGYRQYTTPWARQCERTRTDPEMFFAVMDRHLSRRGIRSLVSAEALTCYRVWRAQDEAERAANAYVLGDRQKAVALLNSSLVRPLLRSSRRGHVARVLVLRTIVRAAAASGTHRRARGLVHFARFRRFPGESSPTSTSTSTSTSPSPGSASGGLAPNATSNAGAVRPSNRPARAVRVFLDPFSHHFRGNALFEPQSRFNRDNALIPWFYLKGRLADLGVSIATGDYLTRTRQGASGRDANVYVSYGIHDAYRSLLGRDDVLLTAFYLFETVGVDPKMYRAAPELARHFRTIYSWTSTEQLRPFVPDMPMVKPFRIPMPLDDVIEAYWRRTDRTGIILVNSNKRAALPARELYTERLRALKHFAARGTIDLWGRLWENGLGDLEPEFGAAVRQSWRGSVDDKYEAMSRYRFAICYENMILDGWITEKLFDCLYAGVVPIYLGAPDIADAVDPACYIDARRFASYDELERYLASLSDGNLERLRVAGRDYLRSEQFRQFSPQVFADRFITDIEAHLFERGLAHLWG